MTTQPKVAATRSLGALIARNGFAGVVTAIMARIVAAIAEELRIRRAGAEGHGRRHAEGYRADARGHRQRRALRPRLRRAHREIHLDGPAPRSRMSFEGGGLSLAQPAMQQPLGRGGPWSVLGRGLVDPAAALQAARDGRGL